MNDLESDVVAQVDRVAIVQHAIDAPGFAELFQDAHFGGMRIFGLAQQELVRSRGGQIRLRIDPIGVRAMHVDVCAAQLLHLGIAAGVVAVHVGVDDVAQVGHVPTDLAQRRQKALLRHGCGAGVDDRLARGVDQVAVDESTGPRMARPRSTRAHGL